MELRDLHAEDGSQASGRPDASPGGPRSERAREHQEHSGRGGGGRPVTEAHAAATDMVGAQPRQSNAAHDAGIDGKGWEVARETLPAG